MLDATFVRSDTKVRPANFETPTLPPPGALTVLPPLLEPEEPLPLPLPLPLLLPLSPPLLSDEVDCDASEVEVGVQSVDEGASVEDVWAGASLLELASLTLPSLALSRWRHWRLEWVSLRRFLIIWP